MESVGVFAKDRIVESYSKPPRLANELTPTAKEDSKGVSIQARSILPKES
jgi:hypothetical protein